MGFGFEEASGRHRAVPGAVGSMTALVVADKQVALGMSHEDWLVEDPRSL